MKLRHYNSARIYFVFRFLVTVFLLIKNKRSLLLIRPLSPDAFCNTITNLGVSFIKLSQVLATRSDFFPPRYLHELQKVHDAVAPMKKKDFDAALHQAFGPVLPFDYFDPNPIASASIGQVHQARIADKKLAVKLKRKGIKEKITADMRILRTMLRFFTPLFSHKTKNSIESVISEYSKMLFEEVSFIQEKNNLEKFSQKYAHCGVIFPTPHPPLCNDDVLVMDFLEGFSFDDKQNIQKAAVDIDGIIKKLVNFYVEQMLLEGYFHADPHPGNLLITPQGELVLLDFGMVKNIGNKTRLALVELIKAANEQDFETYISACKRLGVVSYDADESEMVAFTQKMFSIFENDHLDAKSMQTLATEVLQSTRDMPFKLPQDAIYVLRVSAIIEGLGTTYKENFNGIKDILPILKDNLTTALGGEKLTAMFKHEIHSLPLTIRHLRTIINKAAQDSISVNIDANQLQAVQSRLKDSVKSYAVSFALMLSAFFVLQFDREQIAAVLFVLGFVKLLFF